MQRLTPLSLPHTHHHRRLPPLPPRRCPLPPCLLPIHSTLLLPTSTTIPTITTATATVPVTTTTTTTASLSRLSWCRLQGFPPIGSTTTMWMESNTLASTSF